MHLERPSYTRFLEIAQLDRTVWAQNRLSEYIPDGEHIWRLWMEYSTVYAVVDNGGIVAAAVLFQANIEKLMILHKFFVAKDYRNHGVGRLLLTGITAYLDANALDCMLTTDPVNTGMLKLCEEHGFIEKRMVHGYYRPNEDRYVIFRRYS